MEAHNTPTRKPTRYIRAWQLSLFNVIDNNYVANYMQSQIQDCPKAGGGGGGGGLLCERWGRLSRIGH